MHRMRSLVQMVKEAHPRDTFFDSLDETLRTSPQARAFYRAYDKALLCLDQKSWRVLSHKAVKHFPDHRMGQLKQGFFNQLNEAFAYQFLLRQGYTDVSVLVESGTTTPDLSYKQGASVRYCEVKSIGISEDEIARTESGCVFDGAVYHELSPEFLKKLNDVIARGHEQIVSKGETGIVFILAKFDDFTLRHYGRYRFQIDQLLAWHKVPEIYIKVGLLGGRRIHKRPQ